MALSTKAKKRLEVAMAHRADAQEITTAIDVGFNATPAATVAALGATSNLVGVDGTGSNAAPLAGTEARLDAVEAKVDALIAALKAAGLMDT
jgi:ABC-type hemin transport system substrate-binding protein